MTSHDHAEHGELGHILPKKVYYGTFAALLVLTVITVAISGFDFGVMNLVVAMFIASIKAGIVLLFFMHVRYENPVLWLYIAIPIIALGLMFFGIFIDNPFRVLPTPYPATVESLKVVK